MLVVLPRRQVPPWFYCMQVCFMVHRDILHAMDWQCVVVLVLLDLSVAFDTTDHQVLLHRLSHDLGVAGILLWVGSSPTWRKGRSLSPSRTHAWHPMAFDRCAPGLSAGPQLFPVYSAPLSKVEKAHGLNTISMLMTPRCTSRSVHMTWPSTILWSELCTASPTYNTGRTQTSWSWTVTILKPSSVRPISWRRFQLRASLSMMLPSSHPVESRTKALCRTPAQPRLLISAVCAQPPTSTFGTSATFCRSSHRQPWTAGTHLCYIQTWHGQRSLVWCNAGPAKAASACVRHPSSVIHRKYRTRENKLGCLHASIICCPSSVIPESLHVAIRSVKKGVDGRIHHKYTIHIEGIPHCTRLQQGHFYTV